MRTVLSFVVTWSFAGCMGADPVLAPVAQQQALTPSCVASFNTTAHDQDNLQKYARYRARLRNEFVKVSAGDEPGTNLPAGSRFHGQLRWGDGTIMDAQYIGMLATEYAILHGRNEEAAQETARELHYALRAIDRLDRTAESYFGPTGRVPSDADLNGFFIRDDVPIDFLDKFPMPQASSVESDATCAYPDCNDPNYRAAEMSQDQVWHLMIAFALVKKLVDYKGVIDGEQVDLHAHAKEIARRIITYMRDHDNWRTQNPILKKDVLRGADWDARAIFSYGFAEAADFISTPDTASDPVYPSLHNASSMTAKGAFPLAGLAKDDTYNMRSLALVGDINYFTALDDVGNTLWKLEQDVLTRTLYRYEEFPLQYILLHGGTTRLDPLFYGGLLNAAPPDGPFNHGDDTNSCDWSSPTRLVWPEYNDRNDDWIAGEYNGIDYLYLHNLYQLTFNADKLDALYGPVVAGDRSGPPLDDNRL